MVLEWFTYAVWRIPRSCRYKCLPNWNDKWIPYKHWGRGRIERERESSFLSLLTSIRPPPLPPRGKKVSLHLGTSSPSCQTLLNHLNNRELRVYPKLHEKLSIVQPNIQGWTGEKRRARCSLSVWKMKGAMGGEISETAHVMPPPSALLPCLSEWRVELFAPEQKWKTINKMVSGNGIAVKSKEN